MFRRDLFSLLGYFDVRYEAYADWAFNIKLFGDQSLKCVFVDCIVAKYASDGYSSRNVDYLFLAHKAHLIRQYYPKKIVEMCDDRVGIDYADKDEEVRLLRKELEMRTQELSWIYSTAVGCFLRVYKKLTKRM